METNNFKEILDYIQDKDLLARIDALKKKNKAYSDVTAQDKNTGEELQFVDIVQQGGGTLGISLVGFCFVLEYMGIRFLRLAGTSAGAINTLFMAALGVDKRDAVTPNLFKIIKNLDMFSFVDGHWMAKRIIKSVISKDNVYSGILGAYIIILFLLIFYLPFISRYSEVAIIIYSIFFSIFIVFTSVIIYLFLRFKKAKFGINPGDKFKEFLIDELKKVGISKKSDLDKKATFEIDKNGNSVNNFKFTIKSIEDERVKKENQEIVLQVEQRLKTESNANDTNNNNEKFNINKAKKAFEKIVADYTFITVDIAFQSKVELPKRANLYWENVEEINPADFVRASMSIPIFFEPFFKKIEKTKTMFERWNKLFIKPEDIPEQGIFIDGGSISNFPMNIFHNPNVFIPRLPIFGLRINSEKKKPKNEINNFLDYAGQIIGTMKSSYDKDFLLENLFYEKNCVADINTFETKANWLDFNMSEENKKALFLKGVESALNYLEKFDWYKYKEQRADIYNNE